MEEIKQEKARKTHRKRQAVPSLLPKRKKSVTESDYSSSDAGSSPTDLVEVTRRSIAKWQRTQGDVTLRQLKEHTDFEIHVSSNSNPSVLCKPCGKQIVLGRKNGSVMVSNWTRHTGNCARRKEASTFMQLHFCTRSKSSPELKLASPQRTLEEQGKGLPHTSDAPSKLNAVEKETMFPHTSLSSTDSMAQDSTSELTSMSQDANGSELDISSLSPPTRSSTPPNSHSAQKIDEPHFRLTPPVVKPVLQEGLPAPSTDWSRATRMSLASLRCGSDPNQSKLTDYYTVIDKVVHLLQSNSQKLNVQSSEAAHA